MPYSWEGNCNSGIIIAICRRFQWFIHLCAQGLSNGDEHPTYAPHGYDILYHTGGKDGKRWCETWLISVCEPLRAETSGSISIGRYGNRELSRTGTVRHNSTNRSFICCLCRPLCRLFRPTIHTHTQNTHGLLSTL